MQFNYLIIMLGVGVGFWLASLNVDQTKRKLVRGLQSIAIWIFIATIALKIYMGIKG